MQIGAHDLHVYLVHPEQVTNPALLAAYDRLLSPEERIKRDRFYFQKDRHLCLLARVLVRTTLSFYSDIKPSAWRFQTNTHGRPELVPGQTSLSLKFNLSHTEGLVALVIANGREVGVDVENMERSGETVSVAEHFFSPTEVAALHQIPAEQQREHFFRYWTLKESYIKGRGMGLAIPLDQFSFDLHEGTDIHISFDPKLEDDPNTWQFWQQRATPQHFLAVAAKKAAGENMQLRIQTIVPKVADLTES